MKIVATVKKCVQIGPDDWALRGISHVFDQSATIWDVLQWADHMEKGTLIADIQFTNYDGDSS